MPDRDKVIKTLESILDADIYENWLSEKDRQNVCDAISMLKEQEAVKLKTGHWIFESAYCEAWSHTCSECGKRMSTGYNTYANYCWNCGAKMER